MLRKSTRVLNPRRLLQIKPFLLGVAAGATGTTAIYQGLNHQNQKKMTKSSASSEHKRPQEIVKENADISQYPHDLHCQFTIGDLHGNTLKLIYFLLHSQVLKLSPDDYQKLSDIYYKQTNDLTDTDLHNLKTIFDNSAVNEIRKDAFVRLIGDVFADRGSNDYFTLKLLEKLSLQKVPYEIVFSNHDWEFIKIYEKGILNTKTYLEKAGCASSITNLRILLEKNLITQEEVSHLIKTYYQPNLKLISCSYDENQKRMIIYTHAPVGMNTLKNLAAELNIEFSDKSPAEFIESVNKINSAFSKAILENTASDLFKTNLTFKTKEISLDQAMLRSIWNRGYQSFDLPEKEINGFKLHWVHGHDGDGNVDKALRDRVTNLDNEFGKSSKKEPNRFSYLS